MIETAAVGRRTISHLIQTLLFVAFLCLPESRIAHAEANPSPIDCLEPGYAIVFINGVDNSPEQAIVNRIALIELLDKRSDYKGKPLEFFLVYNPTIGKIGDIAEAARLKAAELEIPFGAAVEIYLLGGLVNSQILPSKLELLQQAVLSFYAEKLSKTLADLESDSDVGQIVAQIKELPLSQAILLVGHSQGTQYANLAFKALLTQGRSRSSIAVTGAAFIPSKVEGDYQRWVSSKQDLLLSFLKLLNVPIAKAEDAGPSASAEDQFAHGFSTVYANPKYEISYVLKSAILGGLDFLAPPSAVQANQSCGQSFVISYKQTECSAAGAMGTDGNLFACSIGGYGFQSWGAGQLYFKFGIHRDARLIHSYQINGGTSTWYVAHEGSAVDPGFVDISINGRRSANFVGTAYNCDSSGCRLIDQRIDYDDLAVVKFSRIGTGLNGIYEAKFPYVKAVPGIVPYYPDRYELAWGYTKGTWTAAAGPYFYPAIKPNGVQGCMFAGGGTYRIDKVLLSAGNANKYTAGQCSVQ